MTIDKSREPLPNPSETIAPAEVIEALKVALAGWDFDNPLAAELNDEYATAMTHWVLETFGQKNNSGEYFLYPDSDGFSGDQLPDNLHHLIMHTWKDEMFLSGENRVRLQSKHIYIEDAPSIPEWNEIRQRFTVFQEMLDYIRSRPDIVAGIVERRIEVIPQVEMTFSPAFAHEWGLQFLINRMGIRVVPFGRDGKTLPAFEYAIQAVTKPAELARTVCQLAVLAAQNSSVGRSRRMPMSVLTTLAHRLDSEEATPICVGNFEPQPGNSVMDLIIERLREDGY